MNGRFLLRDLKMVLEVLIVMVMLKIQLKMLEKYLKMKDMNCYSLESAMNMIAGTARSMGVTIED